MYVFKNTQLGTRHTPRWPRNPMPWSHQCVCLEPSMSLGELTVVPKVRAVHSSSDYPFIEPAVILLVDAGYHVPSSKAVHAPRNVATAASVSQLQYLRFGQGTVAAGARCELATCASSRPLSVLSG